MRTAASVVLTFVALLLGAGSAHAGTWMQVSCVNPDGSAAPSEGWSQSATGPAGAAAINSTQCSPGTPMQADLSDLAAAPPNAFEYLTYTPPGGSTLVGGSMDVNLSADGFGSTSGGGSAAAKAQLLEPDASTEFFQCVAFFQTCGARPDFAGVVNLPSDAGGNLIAAAGCFSGNGTPCDQNAQQNSWALAQVLWARLLLSSSESPTASEQSGNAVQGGTVRGTGHLVFTAAEPAGPGIYSVSVAIDGQPVSTTVPNTNGGKCVPVGTDPTTGALMFDYQQPCLTSEVVDAAVPTTGLSDGTHDVAITLTDAAGSSSTPIDNTITTTNPQTTPNPKGRHALHARFVLSWHWHGATTLLRSIRVNHLLRGAKVAVRCSGRHCPRIKASATGARKVAKLLRRLAGKRLKAGQTLLITVTARRHTAERIAVSIRNGRKPSARLLR